MRTRRVFVAGLAASLPAITTAIAATASADPIFAAIARHRAAFATLETISEISEPAAYATAQRELLASHDALFGTEPQTISGCKALVDFLLEDAGVEDGQGLDLRAGRSTGSRPSAPPRRSCNAV